MQYLRGDSKNPRGNAFICSIIEDEGSVFSYHTIAVPGLNMLGYASRHGQSSKKTPDGRFSPNISGLRILSEDGETRPSDFPDYLLDKV